MGASMPKSAGGGGRRSRRRAAAPISEINVTPFVDVMLVLLIIFMVAAPLLTVGVPLNLPKTNAEALPTEDEEPLTVNIDAQGIIYIQETPAPLEGLLAKLSAIREARGKGGEKVFLRADTVVQHGLVSQVMANLRNAGFTKIGIVTDQAPAQAEQ
jgi:biopolymer transport protein TolR